jgi:hypothetical protein
MRDPNFQRAEVKEARPPGADEAEKDVTRDVRGFTGAIRNRVFSFLRGLVNDDFEQALTYLSDTHDLESQPWTAERLGHMLDGYYAEHERICLDPNARNARHTYVTPSEDKTNWSVQQMLVDPEENNDWVAEFSVDLAKSKAAGEPFLKLIRLGSLSRQ